MFPPNGSSNGDCMKMSNSAVSSESNVNCDNSYTTYTSSHNGLTSGIPTRTTPTLTPTTLKNIEESFMDLHSVPQPPVEHHRQAGFVPPVVNISMLSQNSDSNGSYTSYPLSVKEEDNSQWLPACMQASLSPNSNNSSESNTSSHKGRSGGRRSSRNDRLSPEEEERRRIRRERNKLAAARCRKRRMDHTNSLLDETEGLEDKRQQLHDEIARLRAQKEDLEFVLEAHKASCKLNNNNNSNHNNHHQSQNHHRVVQQPSSSSNMVTPKQEQSVIVSTSSVVTMTKAAAATRPTSLSINPNFSNHGGSGGFKRSSTQFSEATGIPINTPSNGIFNFESLMDGGTGFTPITNCSTGLTPVNTGLTPLISCAGQQRSSSSELSSPDTMKNPKLVSL